MIPKYLVVPIAVTKALQKIHLQVRHPENAEAITGIAVNMNFHICSCTSATTSIAHISLAIPQQGDVVYNDLLKVIQNDYREQEEKIINSNLPSATFPFSGKKLSYFETYYPIEQAIAEVFFESYYNPPPPTDPESPNPAAFEVKLYIRYKLKTPDHDC